MKQEMMGVAVASAEPHANHLHLGPDRYPHQYLITQFFTGRMLFLMPNQQHQKHCRQSDVDLLVSASYHKDVEIA